MRLLILALLSSISIISCQPGFGGKGGAEFGYGAG